MINNLTKSKLFFFKFIFFILIIIISLILLEILLRFYINSKYQYLLKNKEHLNFYKKYTNQLHHLRDISTIDPNSNAHNYIFTFLNGFQENRETILFQGDSRTEGFNIPNIKKTITKYFDQYNFINGGTTSFSPSLMSVQYDILVNEFNIKPDFIIALIDPTDIGDEICRYKKNIKIKNKKIVKVDKEKDPNEIYYLENIILLSEVENSDSSLKILYIKKLFTQYLKKKQRQKASCTFDKIQNHLTHPQDENIDYFKKITSLYVNNLENRKYTKKIFLVTYPHIQNLDSSIFNTFYKLKTSDIINDLNFNNNKIIHIDTYKNNIFKKYQKDYAKIFVRGDPASHLTAHGQEIFFIHILNNFLKYK